MSPSLGKRIPGGTFDIAIKAKERILSRIEKMIIRFQTEYSKDSEQAQTTIMGRMAYGSDEKSSWITGLDSHICR
jgi:hypothetical protein